ncbi:unnamed protein product [Symbiodinium sp. CCMP2592]|nr:unnamed protein product [Symbiodinium sp. CCMP2592]
MSLRIESMVNVLTCDELGVVCQGFHHVNPWGISPRSYGCHRKHAVRQVAEELHSACADLQDAFQLLSAAHVLGSLFANKSFRQAGSSRTLNEGWVLIPHPPVDPPVAAEHGEHDAQPMVIQDCDHAEPPAIIHPIEASQLASEMQAGLIERLVAREQAPDHHDQIIVGQVNRNSAALWDQLLQGPSLRRCLDALVESGHDIRTPRGTLVLVHPWQYENVMRAVAAENLTRSHIVFSKSFEYLLAESFDRVRGAGAWNKSQRPLHISEVGSSSTEPGSIGTIISSELEGRIEVMRTFLVWNPLPDEGPAITASTTDADSRLGANPRRAVHRASAGQ